MAHKFLKFYGWLTNSPSHPPWFEIDPYFSPFGTDKQEVEVPRNHKLKPPATGWCSWYAFGENINEEDILANANWLHKHQSSVPIEYIQIDDGWAAWGDWRNPRSDRFPHGLSFLTTEIYKLGFKSGIWLSPFLVEMDSKIIKDHPDWVVRDSSGKPVSGHPYTTLVPNFIFKQRYILNFHLPEVYDYLLKCIDYLVSECNFDLLKLDFMCGPYFDPAFTDQEHPDNIIHLFLSYIKNAYPDVYLLTGVSPIAPTAGLTDALRISDDIIFPNLRGKWPLNSFIHGGRLKQLEENLNARKKLSKIWNLDPDVFVCSSDTGFSERQIKKLFDLIQKANGVKFLGDDMPKLPPELTQKYVIPLLSDA